MTDSKRVEILSDNPETETIMFGFDAYARTIADLIADKDNQTPFVIGVYGSWGSGKTTLMREIKRLLDTGAAADEVHRRATKTVWFQAWKHADEDAILAALIEEIFRTMKRDSFLDSCKARVEELVKTHQVRAAVGKLTGFAGLDVTAFFAELEYRKKLGFFETFQNFFDALIWDYLRWRPKWKSWEEPDDRKGALVIFIDDLDRCPPDKIVKVLETVKLFLDKKCCAFVLGAADEIIIKALEEKYGGKEAARFMDKIVQVAFKLRPIPADDLKDWVGQERFKLRNKKEILDYMPLLAPALQKNPRQIKRFLNNLNLLAGIIASKGMSIEFSSILSMCVFEYVFPDFYQDIQDNPNNLFVLKEWINKLSPQFESDDVRGLSEDDLQEVPQTLKNYLRVRELVKIVSTFSGKPEEVAQLITLSGMVESPEGLAEQTVKPVRHYEETALVPAGDFLYGENRKKETIETSFQIDIYPVTNDRYRKFLQAGGYSKDDFWSPEGLEWRKKNNITEPRYWNDEKWNKDGHPVVGVCFYEADAFAKWEGKRLSTEIEWERAARGNDGRTYPWGNEFDPEKCNTAESGIGQTTRVTRYPNGTSLSGCYDMAGNVWEWTETDYEHGRKVLRGGSWDSRQDIARCANRLRLNPENRNILVGFRCVRMER
ncbi:MAG: SUMF1/EgtB/PvdO family nonheme iron enzyme [Thermodesulfobacteriota bacterium]